MRRLALALLALVRPLSVSAQALPLSDTTLSNGLHVIVVENHAVPLVTVELDVKNGAYTQTPEFEGLAHLYELAHGMVYLELFTSADRGVFGDTRGTRLRSPAWYRARIREARFLSCGLHCYVPDWLSEQTSAMERCGG